ncbi:hypothetical protein CARUB_v10025598mg, partial [Capsella rubella]
MEDEGTLVRERVYDLKHAGNPSPSRSSPYSLYFKGLVSENTTELSGEFRVAICGYKDGLMFQMKGPIYEPAITLLEAELIALKSGLTEAARLGINHISICCDHNQIYEWVMERSTPEQENIALLIRDVQGIRKRFTSSKAVLVTRKQVEFAYKLGMEAISSKTNVAMATLFHPIKTNLPARIHLKKTCSICFEDVNADEMFLVHTCHHMFCSECVKNHIEVRLAEGYMMTCPQYKCKTKLVYNDCVNILTPKVKEMWEQRNIEESIPVTDRVYCPNPTCSALMSVTNFSQLNEVKQCCVKCGEFFCVNCKVPWHSDLSCHGYKKLHPNPTENDKKLQNLADCKRWRQCSKCKQMIERSDGCFFLLCRCGHKFCYQCGADAGYCYHLGLGNDFEPEDTTSIDIAVGFAIVVLLV